MSIDIDRVKAVVFDYGNTLAHFGTEQVDAYGDALASALEKRHGPLNVDKFNAMRLASRNAPFAGDPPDYKENDLEEITIALVRELYQVEMSETDLKALMEVRLRALVDVVNVEPSVLETLAGLKKNFKLGLLSNYPDGGAIRRSLDAQGLTPYFDGIVVSADLGFCKPHPLVFAAILEQLGGTAQEVLFVGDNWLADVQGAKRVGMQAVYTEQWRPIEEIPRRPGDHQPDATIAHLSELSTLLGV